MISKSRPGVAGFFCARRVFGSGLCLVSVVFRAASDFRSAMAMALRK